MEITSSGPSLFLGELGISEAIASLSYLKQDIACDNFSNSVSAEDGDGKRLPPSLERGQELTGKNITFYECDLVDYERLENIFSQVFYILIQ